MDRFDLAKALGAEMRAGEAAPPGARVVAEREPARFMAAFAEAVAAGGEVFLGDPAWGAVERVQLDEFLSRPRVASAGPSSGSGGRGWLMIPGGGTGGRLKFARHDENTIAAAVRGFCAHFDVTTVNAVGVLPLYHVSGLMAWLRCALTGGVFMTWDWKAIEAGERPALPPPGPWVISLVPTQLQRLLASPEAVDWLRGFRVIFIGGGPAWPKLLKAAAGAGLSVSLSYGMTETAAMVTALRPAEFQAGQRSCGPALPHATVTVTAEGTVAIAGESVFRGYFPEWRESREFITEDLGRYDERGHLHLLGRRDAMIITGGEKVSPVEVEAALRASGEFTDVAVVGVPDAEWGEVVVACYPSGLCQPKVDRAVAALASHQRPKQFVAVADWPRNAQGKVNRVVLVAAAAAWIAKLPVTRP